MHRIDLISAAPRRLLWLVLVVASIIGAVPAQASNPAIEKEVQSLQKKAIEEDNLNVNYAGAIKKLQTAVTKCDGDKCNSSLKAAVLRDLGAMQVLNGNVDEGKASFSKALGMDSSIDLDPAYKNPQLEGIWADVKQHPGAPAGGKAPKAGPQPTGDFVHTPPTEALVRTPLPIYAEYGGDEEVTRVLAKYKAFGMSGWKTLQLKKMDTGFGAMIPCPDVALGLMKYYLEGFNAQNELVAKSGARNKPFSVPVTQQISGEPAALPDQDPPQQCPDTGECPPDFPGCGGKKKSGGDDCDKNSDCASDSCSDGKCVEKKGTGEDCSLDSDCNSGECSGGKCAGKKVEGDDCESDDECDSSRCREGRCAAGAGAIKPRRLWIGLGFQADMYVLPGANDVCIVDPSGSPVNSAGYACATPSGQRFPSNGFYNSEIIPKAGDQVVGGLKWANVRLMLSLDYALNQNMMLGLRAGFVFGTDPVFPVFAPLHLEARYTYLIGHNALTKFLAPIVFLGVGAGEFDAAVPVTVNGALRDMQSGHVQFNSMNQPILLKGTDDAWMTAGPLFASVGGGIRLTFASRLAATAALKFEGAFGGVAGFLPGLAPEVGVQLGF